MPFKYALHVIYLCCFAVTLLGLNAIVDRIDRLDDFCTVIFNQMSVEMYRVRSDE